MLHASRCLQTLESLNRLLLLMISFVHELALEFQKFAQKAEKLQNHTGF